MYSMSSSHLVRYLPKLTSLFMTAFPPLLTPRPPSSKQESKGKYPPTKDNNHPGKFELNSIPSAPRGFPQIKDTFKIGVNGITKVGTSESVLRTSEKGRVSKEDIERIMQVRFGGR